MTSNVIGQINEAQSNINKKFDVVDMLVDGAVGFAMAFSITHRCVNSIRASCYSI